MSVVKITVLATGVRLLALESRLWVVQTIVNAIVINIIYNYCAKRFFHPWDKKIWCPSVRACVQIIICGPPHYCAKRFFHPCGTSKPDVLLLNKIIQLCEGDQKAWTRLLDLGSLSLGF